MISDPDAERDKVNPQEYFCQEGMGKRVAADQDAEKLQRPAQQHAVGHAVDRADNHAADIVQFLLFGDLKGKVGQISDGEQQNQNQNEAQNDDADIGDPLAEHLHDGAAEVGFLHLGVLLRLLRHLLLLEYQSLI